ncbi:MAG: hypothetical protein ACC618_04430 [Patescibacteria group bacterium]
MRKVRRNKLTSKKRKNTFFWVLFSLFVGASVFLTIYSSTSGARLSQLEEKENVITEEIQDTKREIIDLNSLSSLEIEAEALGFIKPKNLIYIIPDDTVAKVP